jgi:hypothetical protein
MELRRMKIKRGSPRNSFTQALEAIDNMMGQELREFFSGTVMTGLGVHSEIERGSVSQKSVAFYSHYHPLRKSLVLLLAGDYRRYFKLALARPDQVGRDPHKWVLDQLQPVIRLALEWIRDWYMLACDGENQQVKRSETMDFVPGQVVSSSIPLTVSPIPSPEPWGAPCWVFQLLPPLTGVGLLKPDHVPANESEEKLGEAHTLLLLKGARRVFLGEFAVAIKRVRNEETAAAGSIPSELVRTQVREPNKRKGWEQRIKLYDAIQKVLSESPMLQGIEFCAALDMRHASPLHDWVKCGDWLDGYTWKEAWGNSGLRKKIRRVRQEAQKYR